MTDEASSSELIDPQGRIIDYLRISVTDRCDLRCVYCMSEKMSFLPRAQLLTLEEIHRLARIFVEMGVGRIRITGGEPLVRRNVVSLIQRIGELPGLDKLCLTTNATQLPRHAKPLKAAGITRINISLDSLRPDRFRRITRNGDLNRVLRGIDAAIEAGFPRIKINAVILKGRNEDEVIDLARFALQRDLDISYIEEMPLGQIDDHDRAESFCSSDDILERLQQTFRLQPCPGEGGGPSRYHAVDGYRARIGFISPHSHNFCASCNRVRLTATGRLLLCLGQEHSVELRPLLRAHPLDDEPVRQGIRDALHLKPAGHDFDLAGIPVIQRHMNATGG